MLHRGAFCLDGFYEVMYGNSVVGKVSLQRQGLYCRVVCRCQIPEDQICRLYAVTETGRENLGVLVPEKAGFFLDRKVPVKRMAGKKLQFMLSSGVKCLDDRFIPIKPEEPFLYVERLQNAFLEHQQGQLGILIKEPCEAV